jgi:predicted membrane-bound spermidine synthase
MLGLGIGSLVGGIVAEKIDKRVHAYVAVELSLGIFGWFSLPLLSAIGHRTAASPPVTSGLAMFAFLCIPTMLMGTTLPLIVKIMSGLFESFGATVARLYFLNTLGAAFGAIAAAYLFISFFGLQGAVSAAVVINLVLAAAIGYVARTASSSRDETAHAEEIADGVGRLAYPLVLVTGFVAIGYEIVTFRVVEVLVKASPYSFASVLAIYLLGIALGSRWMESRLVRRGYTGAKNLYLLLQFALGVCAIGTFLLYFLLTTKTGLERFTRASFGISLHPSFDLPDATPLESWMAATDIVLWPLFFAFPSTCLMGASFPLITALSRRATTGGEGATIGKVYFFNTLGNLAGGAFTGFVLLTYVGTEGTLLLLFTPCLLLGLLVDRIGERSIPLYARAGFVLVCVSAAWVLAPGRGELYVAMHPPIEEALYVRMAEQARYNRGSVAPEAAVLVREGVEGVVVTYSQEPVLRNFFNGMTHGGRPFFLFYREAVEALSHARSVDDVLVIGFGTGSITEGVQRLPEVKSITAIELSGSMIANLRDVPSTRAIVDEPRTRIVVDDARRFLLATRRRFDVVLTDPLRTSTAYSNNLYSREFFELVRSHLKEGGVLMAWSDDQVVVPRTMATVFPYIRSSQWFYLLSDMPILRDSTRLAAVLSAFSPEDQEGIAEVQVRWHGDRASVLGRTEGLPVNDDLHPNSEYFLGLKSRFQDVRENQQRHWRN